MSDTNAEYGIRPTRYRLPDTTRLGRVVLQVSNLERSLSYYRDLLGFDVLRSDGQSAMIGARDAEDGMVELRERSGVRAVPAGGTIGLYHFAVLLPDRAALGRFVDRLLTLNLRFGSADHTVSESIYLWDPDNLGIEVYADRPRQTWRTRGRELLITTDPLDLESVVASARGSNWTGLPPGTTLGHVHLSVGDLTMARTFYHDGLGLDLIVWSYPSALFYSAGRYHHHLATNTWAAHARAAGDDEARLIEWEIVLPGESDVQAAAASLGHAGYAIAADAVATDPWGTRLRLRSSAA